MTSKLKVDEIVNSADTGSPSFPYGVTFAGTASATNLSYTGTLTGGTGVINIGSGQIYKDASGNVGIGGSPGSGDKLQITTTAAKNLIRFYQGGTGEFWIGMLASTNAFVIGDGSGTSTERMRFTGAGDVGIGTSSPISRLHVDSASSTTIRVSTSGGISLFRGYVIGNNAGDSGEYASLKMQVNSGELRLVSGYSGYGGFTTFHTNGAERMRLDSTGNLLVGTTTYDSTFKGILLSSNGRLFATTDAIPQLTLNRLTNDGDAVTFNRSSSSVGSISVTTTATSYNTSSDYRLKENIQPMTGALAKVAQLKPCTYTWKADGSDGQGFIAHELQAVVPDAVTGEKDAVDDEGNPVYQGVDTSFLVATLTAAIQELNAKVEAQAQEIAALKGV